MTVFGQISPAEDGLSNVRSWAKLMLGESEAAIRPAERRCTPKAVIPNPAGTGQVLQNWTSAVRVPREKLAHDVLTRHANNFLHPFMENSRPRIIA
jgi:hypothetical protein